MFCLRTYTFLDIAIKSDNVSKWNIFTLGGREIVVASKEVSKRNVQNHGISNKIVIYTCKGRIPFLLNVFKMTNSNYKKINHKG